ncbi:MAG: MATE family efflux transporter [Gemmataceae bacterium]|nr:MATE family efflux transporter [Gemmata sp.]MDW8198703.1 MATE family efflux transporter [Gemmataceae bacterium]
MNVATGPPERWTRPLWRQVLALALPALAQQYLHLIVQLSDQFLAGRFPLPDPSARERYLSALNTAGYLYWFVSSYTVLVSVGSTALVARFIGAGDRTMAQHATGQSVLLAVVFGAVGTLAALLGLPTLLAALQLTGDAADYCQSFLTPLAALLVFQMTESACVACLAGAGDTRTGLKVLGFVAVVNIPLAWSLCFGVGPWPGLGFVGISWGTGLSHVIGCVWLVRLLARGQSGLQLQWRHFWPDRPLLRRLLWVSVPAAVDSLSVAFFQLWFLSLVNRLGDTAASAHGIALRWEALAYLAGGAFGTAAMTLVGQNLGAQMPARAARCAWTAYALGGGVMCVMGLLFVLFAQPMFRLFCPEPELQPVVAAGVPVLRLIAVAMPALAAQIIFTAALRGAGDARLPVLISWLGFLGVRIPLAYWLTGTSIVLGALGELPQVDLGLLGAWIAMCADIWIRGLFFTLRFAGGRWKMIQV